MITISLDELIGIKFDKFFDELSFQNETPSLRVKQLLNKLENDIRSSLKIESRHSITEYEEVYDEGYETGRELGREESYDEGYQSGYADGKAEKCECLQ